MDAHGNPILISTSNESTQLERVPLSSNQKGTEYNEDWLQDLVFRHPDCLPIREIDSGYSPLVPLCREMNTRVGRIDAVFATPDGRIVLLEAKLWRNPEARRKVVGQILDYAKEISKWSYSDFQREVSLRRQDVDGDNRPYEIIRSEHSQVLEADFVDGIERSLQRGDFMLLVVGDGIREGVGGIAEYLEGATSLDFTFGLVELAIHAMPDGGRLVQPRVLTRTVTIRRSVIRLEGGDFELEEDTDESSDGAESEEKETSEAVKQSNEYHLGFWEEFFQKLHLDDPEQPLPNPSRKSFIYLPLLPSSDSRARLYIGSRKDGKTVVHLNFYLSERSAPLGRIAYPQLEAEREEIDLEIDGELSWERDDRPNGHGGQIFIEHTFPDSHQPQRREEIMNFLTKYTNQFVNTFRPRVQRIDEKM